MPAVATSLPELLHRVFGHREFRAHQQPVCEAAASGRDVLLVMPTGAGKSLCYQLPALARNGTALVISPLIALMDDQASKLEALHLRVARIHSGRSRDESRQACRDYLDGNLDFLFIAPERLRVPGFPEMLAKRKPALIAIDEAHCISQWGHDFRPDYRTLAQHLQALRPSPVIALTATATPTVQRDILHALNLQDPAVFITGFRRNNLHIEVTELSKPQRTEFIAKILAEPGARPAIVYASSRRSAEELATALARKFPAAAYHAGLDAGTRERVQRSFTGGKLDVVVATVAFGMGVDKADVRTVIHAALPGSVEAYYQEIGRAGRDGLPARTVLLHGFADRKTQEFLLDRSYPPLTDLQRVAEALRTNLLSFDELLARLSMDRETLERCVEKLVSQGAATADFDGSIRCTAETGWEREYDAQLRHRREQIDRMIAFADGNGCRMAALVRHFGDKTDGGQPCGCCDFCNPQGSSSAPAHQATAGEKTDLLTILHALKDGSRSTGKLFTETRFKDRKHFDRLLEALGRAGLLSVTTESFRGSEGNDVSYRKVSLTSEGHDPDEAALGTVWLRDGEADSNSAPRKRSSSAKSSSGSAIADVPLSSVQAALLEQLKAWRTQRAKDSGKPPFLILPDASLLGIAAATPQNLAALGSVRGIGPEKLDRFGAEIISLCRQANGGASKQVGEEKILDTALLPQKSKAVVSKASAPKPTATATIHRMDAVAQQQQAVRPNRTAIAPVVLTEQQITVENRLREWRREQAMSSGLPTFFILSETALRKLALLGPTSLDELRSVAEIGADKVARYGNAMIGLCREG
ncbi:MAG: RecQ family ATP-dependent DNA helicase [Janthinobacterium lividum]